MKYRNHLTETSSYIETSFHHWLLLFTGFLAYQFLMIVTWLISGGQLSLSILYFSFVFFNITVFASILFKPELFQTFPHQMPIPNSSEEKTQKYESSNLQEEQKEKYLIPLQSKMSSEKYYSERELTIQQLSNKYSYLLFIPNY